MQKSRLARLRRILLSWFFLGTVMILAAVAVLTYLSYMQATNELVVDRDREVTNVSAARLADELVKFTGTLESLARTEDMYSGSLERQKLGLKKARLRLTIFDGGVVLLDNFGNVAASEPDRVEVNGQNWADREYFRHLLTSKSPVFSNMLNDGPQASRVVVAAVPIIGPDGEFIGGLAGLFRLGSPTISSFYASIVRLRMDQHGIAYLIDSKGRIIYHTDSLLVGRYIINNQVVEEVLNGDTGAVRTRNQAGQDIVAAYAPVPGTPWGLVTEENWSTLTASTREYGQILLILLGLGMVLPAFGVAQVVRQRNKERLESERIHQEMLFARTIQKTLLPRELPALPGWEIAVHWQPARAVGGDFYDFLPFPDGQIGIVIADVTDKGVPAALVMASARSIIRGVSDRLFYPGPVLERVNNLLANDIPHNMFVTCMYALLDPSTGRMRYANAGQNLPYRKDGQNVRQLEATGMPMGLLPSITYDEYETTILPGEVVMFYSDGLVEAHDPRSQMFGNRRLQKLLDEIPEGSLGGDDLIDHTLAALKQFTGSGWEQEDDVTLVVIRRLSEVGKEEGGQDERALVYTREV